MKKTNEDLNLQLDSLVNDVLVDEKAIKGQGTREVLEKLDDSVDEILANLGSQDNAEKKPSRYQKEPIKLDLDFDIDASL